MSDYLPEEILTEILLKLPVKSLIRGTSVCKEWRTLIRSPSFISAHLSLTENRAFFYDRQKHFTLIPKRGPLVINHDSGLEFPFECKKWDSKVVGSCDGLVCVSDDSQRIIIWNPAIRKQVVLPPVKESPVKESAHSVLLGFGVANNVPKVLRLVDSAELLEAKIFCLDGTGRWRKLTGLDDVRVCHLDKYTKTTIFFKGFLHWTVYEAKSHSTYPILRFHVGDEVFGEIMLPEELELEELEELEGLKLVNLAIIGESLGAIKCEGRILGYKKCDVWVMKEYGVKESWTKLYRIDIEKLVRVLGFWRSDEALLVVLPRDLATYNVETKRIKRVGVPGRFSYYVNDYKESLVLLGGGHERILL